MRYVRINTIANEQCKREWPMITANNVRTRSILRKGQCAGDSGGAIIFDDKLYAIVVAGLDCLTTIPRIGNRISYNLQWIIENTDGEIDID